MRWAYADPPYPGKSELYRGHRDYGGEVDHAALLSQLQGFDTWALSTSAEALPRILALCVAQDLHVRVAAWFRRSRPHQTARVVNAWEPVVYSRSRQHAGPRATDALRGVAPRRRPTLPDAVIGMKPADFCEWLFALVGAQPGDDFSDLFPGSGVVSRAWSRYAHPSPEAPSDAYCAETSFRDPGDGKRGAVTAPNGLRSRTVTGRSPENGHVSRPAGGHT